MKKVLSIAIVLLTLCVQHESHAMGGLRNYASRLGQYAATRTQQVAPACRSFTSGIRQQFSNITPQTSQLFRSMQASARTLRQNLPLTRRETLLGLGAGTGLGSATNLLLPDGVGYIVAHAEEEAKSPKSPKERANLIFEQLKAMANESETSVGQFDSIAKELEANPYLTQELADTIEGQRESLYWLLERYSYSFSSESRTDLARQLVNINSIQREINVIKNKIDQETDKRAFLICTQLTATDNVIQGPSFDQLKNAKEELEANPYLKQKVADTVEGQRKAIYYFLEHNSRSLSQESLLDTARHLNNLDTIQRKLDLPKKVESKSSSWWPFSK